MRYEKVEELKESDFKRLCGVKSDFKRLCGVKKETYLMMCEIVKAVLSRETRGGKSGLAVEDQVLLTRALLAGISNDVSFGARFRFARIKCFADYSEG